MAATYPFCDCLSKKRIRQTLALDSFTIYFVIEKGLSIPKNFPFGLETWWGWILSI
jgi:hypothetical protein